MKTKWTEKFPEVQGWYWCKYKGNNGTVICPADVFKDYITLVKTARNDMFYSDNRFGDNSSLRFGPKIEEPE